MRSLSPDEQALWERVAATIRPLSRLAVKHPVAPSRGAQAKAAQGSLQPAPRPLQSPASPQARTLDSTWDRRLRSGEVQPDRVIDLHGMTLDRAWSAIDRGLEHAIGARERVVLLITGHARKGDPPIERGKIRAAVHDWLEASRHASRIAAVRGAHARHGGGGSLYIILRRNRSKSTLF